MDLEGIKSIETIYLALMFAAPGLIIVYFRSRFITGRRPKTSEYVLEYIAISTAYLALSVPFVEFFIEARTTNWIRIALWLLLLGVVPACVGIVLGTGTQRGWWRFLFGKLGLSLVSPYPTGWDWIFSRLRQPAFLLITLEDGSQVAGYFGWDSLASSDPSERDLYLEEIYDLNKRGQWKARKEKQGILISGKNIKHVEIWRAPSTEKV